MRSGYKAKKLYASVHVSGLKFGNRYTTNRYDGALPTSAAKGANASAEATSRFRSGKASGWAARFTKEQSEAMDALYAKRAGEWPGHKFDFGANPYAKA